MAYGFRDGPKRDSVQDEEGASLHGIMPQWTMGTVLVVYGTRQEDAAITRDSAFCP